MRNSHLGLTGIGGCRFNTRVQFGYEAPGSLATFNIQTLVLALLYCYCRKDVLKCGYRNLATTMNVERKMTIVREKRFHQSNVRVRVLYFVPAASFGKKCLKYVDLQDSHSHHSQAFADCIPE